MFDSTCILTKNLTKFARFHKAQSVSMGKVEHQAFPYVKVLRETHLHRSVNYERK